MEEVRAAAMANYANMSVDRKQAVQDFYRALDVNGDGKVTRQEYLDALEKNGWNQNNSLPSNLFEVLDKNHDGTLDLEECVTFYYMIAGRRLVSCDACRSYMLGLYFLCVKCYDDVNKEKTYKLCCPCYHNKHFKHGHSYFLDNFVLLRRVRTKLQEGNTSAGPRRSSSISKSKGSKGTKIVDAFEETEEKNSSKSSQIQKSSHSPGETNNTELAIDQFAFGDTANSDVLCQDDGKPEMQENPLYQENPLVQDDDSFLQVNKGTSSVPANTELDKNNVQQDLDPTAHHESIPTNGETEQNPSVPTVELNESNVDSQIPQQSQGIDLNLQEGMREDVVTAQLMDVPVLEGCHGTSQLTLDGKEPKKGPIEGSVKVRETQVVPIQKSDRGLEDVASSPTGNQITPAPVVNISNLLAIPMNVVVDASPRSVNKVGTNPTRAESSTQAKSSSNSLDHLMEEMKSTSQAFRSLIEVSESSSSFFFLQYSDETQKEIQGFFDFLKLPFEELVTTKSVEFTACIESLAQRLVFPLREQIVLENFASSLSDNASLFRYYQREIGQKQELIDNLSNLTAKLSTMHNDASTLKSRIVAIEQKEQELLRQLGQLQSEKENLLMTASQLDKDFKCLAEEGKGVSVHVSAAREDLQRNIIKCDELFAKWETFKSFFLPE